jgi:DNA-binding NtrC family response regulator
MREDRPHLDRSLVAGVDRDLASRTLPEILADHERLIIIEALAHCGGSRTRAAAALGIRRERLYRRMLYLKIDLDAVAAAVGRPKKSLRSESGRRST